MKIFLDSANLKEIDEAVQWGAIDGITTNPSLLAKELREFIPPPAAGPKGPGLCPEPPSAAAAGGGIIPLVQDICRRVNGPISVETTSRDAAGMVEEGTYFAGLHPNIVVKCPLTKDGLTATRQLSSQKIRVNVTLCFSPTQALLAAKAGAYFVSPFVGRLDDVSQDGMALIRDIKVIYANYRFATQILVASVRHPIHVVEAATIGADIATMPFGVLEQLVKHPLTDLGVERFLRDWDKLPPDAKRIGPSAARPSSASGSTRSVPQAVS